MPDGFPEGFDGAEIMKKYLRDSGFECWNPVFL